LDRDDFVVDDNGEGYADDGREEDWEDGHYDEYASGDEEEDGQPRGKAGTPWRSKFPPHFTDVTLQPRRGEKKTRRSARRSEMALASTSARRPPRLLPGQRFEHVHLRYLPY
jgi:hypothetical protein